MVAGGVVCHGQAKAKGRAAAGWTLFGILCPLPAIIIIICLRSKSKEGQLTNLRMVTTFPRRCPKCGALVQVRQDWSGKIGGICLTCGETF
jgi:hypothetical protein